MDHSICLETAQIGPLKFVNALTGSGNSPSACSVPGGNVFPGAADTIYWHSDNHAYQVSFFPLVSSTACNSAACWPCSGAVPPSGFIVVNAGNSPVQCDLTGKSVKYGVRTQGDVVPLDPVIVIREEREPGIIDRLDITGLLGLLLLAAAIGFLVARYAFPRRN